MTFFKTAVLAAAALSTLPMLSTHAAAQTTRYSSSLGDVDVVGNSRDGYAVRRVRPSHRVRAYTSCEIGYVRNRRGHCVPVVVVR